MDPQDRREVRKAARGDRDAAGLLFDHYYPRVYRYALAKLGRAADAEDVAAETFARVLANIDHFRWRGAGFEAWLFRIAYHLVVDHVRASGRAGNPGDELDSPDFRTPEVAALAGEASAGLRRLLARLSPEQREVLLLRFGADLDATQIGKIMGKRANAIRQLQFRALARLREMMQQEDEARLR